ncbi:protein of unknown function [Ruminococcaceae bacterium BL-6]|nr:protein of unknown function [Ruminococcaceae bacterium BL-6]
MRGTQVFDPIHGDRQLLDVSGGLTHSAADDDETSLAYSVTVVEILGRAKVLASQGYTYLEAYIDVAVISWVLCILFENLFYLIEKRIKRFRAEIKV